jgi:hypothetical protein
MGDRSTAQEGQPTPLIGRKTGKHPKRTQKDSGRGTSGGPLTRAFTGSKPLHDQPLYPSLGTVLTLIFGDGWQMDAPCRLTVRVPPLAQTRFYARPGGPRAASSRPSRLEPTFCKARGNLRSSGLRGCERCEHSHVACRSPNYLSSGLATST